MEGEAPRDKHIPHKRATHSSISNSTLVIHQGPFELIPPNKGKSKKSERKRNDK